MKAGIYELQVFADEDWHYLIDEVNLKAGEDGIQELSDIAMDICQLGAMTENDEDGPTFISALIIEKVRFKWIEDGD